MKLRPQSAAGIVLLAAAATGVFYGLFARSPEQVNTSAGVPVMAGNSGVPQSVPGRVVAIPAAANVPMGTQRVADAGPTATDVAPNYVGPRLQVYEAHWQGMDTMQFTEEVRKKLKYPRGFEGILIGEVTMAAGRSGLLAGDVLTAVDGVPVRSLEEFQRQTKVIRNKRQASISVMRKGKQKQAGRYVMSRRSFVLQADDVLGFAQVEAAPMIVAGDPPPHPYRGPCTQCHAIGEGWELAPDPDLINLPPPKIAQEVVARGERPHRDFGPCKACHIIVP